MKRTLTRWPTFFNAAGQWQAQEIAILKSSQDADEETAAKKKVLMKEFEKELQENEMIKARPVSLHEKKGGLCPAI